MPAALYLPRRHRRHLLFPPGLLALAGLLWLGGVAVPKQLQHPGRTALEIALPSLKIPEGILGGFITAKQVERMAPWQSVTVSGCLWTDYFSLRMVEFMCLPLAKSGSERSNVRVYMSQFTTYNSFVTLLDMAQRLHVRRYWLDFRKVPYVLYLPSNESFLESPIYVSASNIVPPFICGNTSSFPPVPTRPDVPRVELPAILSPIWRNTWLLLLLLTALSGWKLRRQWRAAG
ncbi:hypothetical protein [Hymenobacter sp. UYP22]|uniref:hypothetical protein n=1 Tax=Hymenobacter sp. UYP22 TaxID=3156348 RepID=UPI0033942FCE